MCAFKFGWLADVFIRRIIYSHPANKITSQSWSLVLTAAIAKLGILIEFLFGWLLNLAALTPIAPAAGFDVCF